VITEKCAKTAEILRFLTTESFPGIFFHTATRQKLLGEGKNFPAALIVEIEGSFQFK